MPATVALTITTDDDALAKVIEPFAPSPSQRIRAVQDLTKAGIPVSVRIDPIIPTVNDHYQELVATLASIGVKHITASTYKAKPDNWMRLTRAAPSDGSLSLYFQQGERIGGNVLLPKNYRFKLLKGVRDLAVASNSIWCMPGRFSTVEYSALRRFSDASPERRNNAGSCNHAC